MLDLPYDDYYARRFAMYYQTEHGHPILFAAYPRAPRSNREHFEDNALFAVLSDPALAARALETRLASLDLEAEREALRGQAVEAFKLGFPVSMAQGRAIERWLSAAWGAPERVSAGFYGALVFRL